MKILLTAFVLFLPPGLLGGEIASVNYKKIESDLRDLILSRSENASLKQEYEAALMGDEERQELMRREMEAARESGQKPDLSEYFKASSNNNSYKIKKTLKKKLKTELFLLIQEMGLEYEFIFDSSESDPILYAKSGISDITQMVHQHIISASKAEPNKQSASEDRPISPLESEIREE